MLASRVVNFHHESRCCWEDLKLDSYHPGLGLPLGNPILRKLSTPSRQDFDITLVDAKVPGMVFFVVDLSWVAAVGFPKPKVVGKR